MLVLAESGLATTIVDVGYHTNVSYRRHAMRVLRAKAVRKHLRFYRLIFNTKAPYHVIVDGNFIFAALKHKFDLKHRLEALLQDDVRLYILRSSLDELISVGEKASDAVEFARNCCELMSEVSAISDPRTPVVQFLEKISREGRKRYFFASQDDVLRESVKSIPGIPTIYFNKVTLVLEAPSSASLNFTAEVERRKLEVSRLESEQLSSMGKRSRDNESGDDEGKMKSKSSTDMPKIKRKRHALAPNPLSNRAPQTNSKSNEKKKMKNIAKGANLSSNT